MLCIGIFCFVDKYNALFSFVLSQQYEMFPSELSHWPVHKGRVYTLEATAYALLALVKTQVSMSHLSFTRM